jgi:DNA-binding NarL/FixJ family response regulator
MKNIIVSIVDDVPIFATTLSNLLNDSEGIEIAFIADNGVDFFTKLALSKKQPDIVLMDLSMPVMNGIDATKILKEDNPDIKVIIMTNHDDVAFIVEIMEYGAEGYLLKNTDITRIIKVIQSVYKGNKYYSFEVLTKVSNSYCDLPIESGMITNKLSKISARELQVLKLLCKAKTNREISQILAIEEKTVETHKRNLIAKTGAKSTIELILMALYHRIAIIDRPYYMEDPFAKLNG